jgi:tetratricopeptide (TPR) repeat protein
MDLFMTNNIMVHKTRFFYYTISTLILSCVIVSTYFLATYFFSDSLKTDKLLKNSSDFEKAQYYFTGENYDLTKARHYYESSISNNPKENPYQWYQLARINFIQGEFDVSLHNLDMQVQHYGDEVPSVHYMYGLVYGFRADAYSREQDFDLAEAHFKKFLEYKPESPWARIDLSWIHFSQRDFDSMLATLEPVYEQEKNNPWFLNMYGLALLNVEEVERAVEHFAAAAEFSSELDVQDWSSTYPGNNPVDYQTGLDEFLLALNLNLELAQKRLTESGNNEENLN